MSEYQRVKIKKLIKERSLVSHYTLLIKWKCIKYLNSTANPISDNYIEAKKQEKKVGEDVNKLMRSEKMTRDEAKGAVQTLKQDEPRQKRAIKKVERLIESIQKNNIIH